MDILAKRCSDIPDLNSEIQIRLYAIGMKAAYSGISMDVGRIFFQVGALEDFS